MLAKIKVWLKSLPEKAGRAWTSIKEAWSEMNENPWLGFSAAGAFSVGFLLTGAIVSKYWMNGGVALIIGYYCLTMLMCYFGIRMIMDMVSDKKPANDKRMPRRVVPSPAAA